MIDKLIEKLESFAKAKHSKPCIITYNGEQIKVPSGKVSWRNKGDAKKALTNALSNAIGYWDMRALKEESGFSSVSEFLESKGIIKFVTFDKDLDAENSMLRSKIELYEAIDEHNASVDRGNPQLEQALHDAIEELGMTEKVYEIIHRDYPMGGDVEL